MSIAKGPATNVHPAKGGDPAAAPAPSSSIRQEVSLDAIAGQANRLAQESLSFWLKHGPDTAYGGFHAVRRNFGVPETLNRGGVVVAPYDKGIVQQARHCWAMSHAVASGAVQGEQAKRAEAAARSTWAFMNKAMRRTDGLWAWLVTRNGSRVVDPGPSLYGHFFVIYAAVEFGKAFGDATALKTALATFRAVDSAFHDSTHGGYNETSSLPVLHSVRLPGKKLPQTLNTFLHGIESIAALYNATEDEAVLVRLQELTQLVTSRLITKHNAIYEFYDPATWMPVGPPSINFGHNLESAWVVAEANRVMVKKGKLSATAAGAAAAKLAALRAAALRDGYDKEHGGVFEAGVPGQAPGIGEGASTKKVWWIQAESMLALLQADLKSEDPTPLKQLNGTLEFVRTHIYDPVDGEWVWQTDAAGSVIEPYYYQKGNIWKASYHGLRSMLFVQQWIKERAGA